MISTETHISKCAVVLFPSHPTDKRVSHQNAKNQSNTNDVFIYPTAFCQLPSDEGEGPNFNFALHYDPVADKCFPFIYRGQGGNANRFENERECIRNCSANSETVYPMDGKILL